MFDSSNKYKTKWWFLLFWVEFYNSIKLDVGSPCLIPRWDDLSTGRPLVVYVANLDFCGVARRKPNHKNLCLCLPQSRKRTQQTWKKRVGLNFLALNTSAWSHHSHSEDRNNWVEYMAMQENTKNWIHIMFFRVCIVRKTNKNWRLRIFYISTLQWGITFCWWVT